ncbi:hypothetical protein Taro_032216 [Colocasia esculenta]|uniref:aldehyde oxygenase (deformylating) n=1 Tax=Colocasia esculenta TaxID=4460 RepID=A0A843VKS9_COLES|nr:hypothetical protein [Colocasia esculenta]
MGSFTTDELLGTFTPILVYWMYSGLYELFAGPLEKYRLHSRKKEDAKNLVSKRDVVRGVLLQQVLQATISLICFKVVGEGPAATHPAANPSIFATARQFFVAMFVFDAWQFFMHRYMHQNKFLYKHLHSWHHRLVVPYAFGAQYNHPIDGLLIETVSGALAYAASGMSPRMTTLFFCFATIKGIDDHCGYMLPWNPFHLLLGNNSAYHDIHHQLSGSKCNFSQPFFIVWDKIFGTCVPYKVEKRAAGGFVAKAAEDY